MSEALPNKQELLKRACFVPCHSKEALHRWVKIYLGLDIPDCKVDPESTTSPMDMLWELYRHARDNDDPEFSQVLAYAARDSFKTLCASILELLMIVHLKRSVAHMAAIESQARKAQSYVKKFLSRPFLRDFVVGNNQRSVNFIRYENRATGENLTQSQWEALPSDDLRDQYVEENNYIVIVVATMAGANSEHVPFMCVDEVDVVANPAAYEEAKMIPAQYGDNLPITLYTSSRKFSFGLVQQEIDKADKSGLIILHWNLIDVTQRCPEKRHLPMLPKIPIYRSDETLQSISEDEYNLLSNDQKEKFVKDCGYQGCLKNCKIFAACKGLLATKQTSKSPLLKRVEHTQNMFRKVSIETAKAQLLCWKPSTEGLIYARFDRAIHMLSPAQMAEKLTGEPYSKVHPEMTKPELLALFKTREGVQFFAGMDFGFSHNFAVVTGAKDGGRFFVFDVIAQNELELGEQVDICQQTIKPFNPAIFADVAYPSNIATFKRNGFRMRDWPKTPGSVKNGIEIVRFMLRPPLGGEPRLFFLKGDEGCELLATRITQYHWMLNAAGKPTDKPEQEDDDELDALRYVVMNVFAPRGTLSVGKPEDVLKQMVQSGLGQDTPQYHPKTWMRQVIAEQLGIPVSNTPPPPPIQIPTPVPSAKQQDPTQPVPMPADYGYQVPQQQQLGRRGRRGNLVWDI